MPRKFQASYSSRIAARLVRDYLIDSGAVRFDVKNPRKLPSGLVSPVIIDTHVLMTAAGGWRDVIELLLSRIDEAALDADIVAGTDAESAMQAQAVAFRLGVPAVEVHIPAFEGDRTGLRGADVKGKRVVLIVDHVAAGVMCLAAVKALREAGATVEAVLAVTNFGFDRTRRIFDAEGLRIVDLVPFAKVVDSAVAKGYIKYEEGRQVHAWLKTPVFA